MATALGLGVILVFACSTPSKIDVVRQNEVHAQLALSRNELEEERKVIEMGRKDTLRVKDDATGEESFIMHAIKDDNGEMVAATVRWISVSRSSCRRRCRMQTGSFVSIRTCSSCRIPYVWKAFT